MFHHITLHLIIIFSFVFNVLSSASARYNSSFPQTYYYGFHLLPQPQTVYWLICSLVVQMYILKANFHLVQSLSTPFQINKIDKQISVVFNAATMKVQWVWQWGPMDFPITDQISFVNCLHRWQSLLAYLHWFMQ